MRTDKLLYLLLQLAPQGFFSLIGRSPDDASRYEFKSVELKETSFRIDGVFVPKSNDDFTYFVEAQFQQDEQFYARFFAEIFLYLKQYPTAKWQAIAIYPSRSVEQKAIESYLDLLSLDRFKRVYLDELPQTESVSTGLFKLLVEPERSARERARKMAAKANLIELDLIEQIATYKFSKLSREEIKAMLGIQEELLKETRFYKDVFEEGKLEGRQEGKREGERQAKLATVPLLRRLGLTDETIAKELGLALDAVQSVPRNE